MSRQIFDETSFGESFSMRLVSIFSVVLILTVADGSGGCDQYSDYALSLYRQGKYAEAKSFFDKSLKLSPKNDNSHFYRAVCQEQLHNLDDARLDYQFVANNSNNAAFVSHALSALERLGDRLGNRLENQVAGDAAVKQSRALPNGKAGSVASAVERPALENQDGSSVIPNEARVYFTQSGHNDIYIDAQVNGRDLKMILDTGASVTLIGKNQLEPLGLRLPSGEPTASVGGIGGSRLPAWIMPIQINVGGIKKTVRVSVPETWEGRPLLGQDFYSDLEYEFDNRGHCIYFRKPKPLTSSEKSMYCIPFTRQGRHLLVEVEVDGGHRTGMFVDTGAEGIAMTMVNLKELGIDIPADARRSRSTGVGGTASGYSFTIEALRLGPIVQRSPQITVTTSEDGMLGTKTGHYGLLGQAFFGDWRFTVDNSNNLIRFFH